VFLLFDCRVIMQIQLAVYQLALLRRNVWLRPLLLTTVKGKLVLFLLGLAALTVLAICQICGEDSYLSVTLTTPWIYVSLL
jgi:hypothetical protein